MVALWLVALSLPGLGACRDPDPEFPAGLGPLEENQAPWPAGDAPEALAVVSGERDGYAWAHARGWVHASVAETWAALQDPAVAVDRRRVDEWTVTGLAPTWDVAFLIHNVVHDVVTVEFDVEWQHGVVAGDTEAPEAVGARFDKTGGTEFIERMQGSVILVEDGDVTAVELQEHLEAILTGVEEVENYLLDLHADLVARVHDEPLPEHP